MLRVLLIAMLVACGGKDDSSPGVASGVAADAAAGKVRELTGKVTATRGSETRTLAVGGQISGDDVVDTGTDGSVVIELAHNNALWSLESGIKARVDQSPAWSLDKQAAAKPIDHATSSAGRHADRQAADTQITANEAMKQDPKPEAPSSVAAAPPPPPPTAAPGPKVGKDPVAANKPMDKGSSPKPSGACDEVSCVMDGSAPCCAKYKKSSIAPQAPSGGDIPDSPSANDVRVAMLGIKQKLSDCVVKAKITGRFQITFHADASGKIATAQIKDAPDHAADQCLLAAIRTMKLPASRNGVTVNYPLVFN